MNFRRNMAYAEPSDMAYMKMTKAQLKKLAAEGDSMANAEIARRARNAADPEHQSARTGRGRSDKRQRGATAADVSAGPTVQGPEPMTQREAQAVENVETAGSAASEATVQAATGTGDVRTAQAAQAQARAAADAAVRSAPAAAKKARAKAVFGYERKRIDLERHYLHLTNQYTLDQAVELYRAGQWPPGRAQTRSNPLPYPGATMLYPQQGIVQGGTGPFYGPTGTLFDKMPDMLWDYPMAAVRNNGKSTRRNGVQVLWPQSARAVGVIQGGTSRTYGPDGVPFNNYPDLTEKLLLNGKGKGKRTRNPRMTGETILWPQPESLVGPIQGGAEIYMEYPSAAPFDRMPNLTTVLKNKKRSR